jgi:RNA polymerase sigma factor (sigma-70 family)
MKTDSLMFTADDLALLDSVIAALTRSRRMRAEDAEDFRQTVYVRLAQRGGGPFSHFEGRSSLRTYVNVVVYRMLLDWQNHQYGKWRPSVAATRRGSVAVMLERLTSRDRLSIEQAIEQMRTQDPRLAPRELRALADTQPMRPRRQLVQGDEVLMAQRVDFEDPLEQAQKQHMIFLRRAMLARALVALGRDERLLIWLRYRRRLTVREVAGRIDAHPKSLYRRFDRILLTIRRQLIAEGVRPASAQ